MPWPDRALTEDVVWWGGSAEEPREGRCHLRKWPLDLAPRGLARLSGCGGRGGQAQDRTGPDRVPGNGHFPSALPLSLSVDPLPVPFLPAAWSGDGSARLGCSPCSWGPRGSMQAGADPQETPSVGRAPPPSKHPLCPACSPRPWEATTRSWLWGPVCCGRTFCLWKCSVGALPSGLSCPAPRPAPRPTGRGACTPGWASVPSSGTCSPTEGHLRGAQVGGRTHGAMSRRGHVAGLASQQVRSGWGWGWGSGPPAAPHTVHRCASASAPSVSSAAPGWRLLHSAHPAGAQGLPRGWARAPCDRASGRPGSAGPVAACPRWPAAGLLSCWRLREPVMSCARVLCRLHTPWRPGGLRPLIPSLPGGGGQAASGGTWDVPDEPEAYSPSCFF